MSADRIRDIPDASWHRGAAIVVLAVLVAASRLTICCMADACISLASFICGNKDMNSVVRRVRATSTTSDKVEFVSTLE